MSNMFKYYLKYIVQLPGLISAAKRQVVGWSAFAAVGYSLIALFNPQLARWLNLKWQQQVFYFTLITVAIVVAYQVLTAIYLDIDHLKRRVAFLEATPQPRLVFGVPYVSRKEIRLFDADKPTQVLGKIVPDPYFAHVKVQYCPERPVDTATAHDAIIWLRYFTDDGRQVVGEPVKGRWADNPQPASLPPHQTISPLYLRDLKPNGDRHEIDLLIKYPNDECCYAFGTQSCREPRWLIDPWRIPLGGFLIQLRITATGLEQPVVQWYRVENDADSGGARIKAETAPTWAKAVADSDEID